LAGWNWILHPLEHLGIGDEEDVWLGGHIREELLDLSQSSGPSACWLEEGVVQSHLEWQSIGGVEAVEVGHVVVPHFVCRHSSGVHSDRLVGCGVDVVSHRDVPESRAAHAGAAVAAGGVLTKVQCLVVSREFVQIQKVKLFKEAATYVGPESGRHGIRAVPLESMSNARVNHVLGPLQVGRPHSLLLESNGE